MPLEPRREALPLLPRLSLGDNDLVLLALGARAGHTYPATTTQKLQETMHRGVKRSDVGARRSSGINHSCRWKVIISPQASSSSAGALSVLIDASTTSRRPFRRVSRGAAGAATTEAINALRNAKDEAPKKD